RRVNAGAHHRTVAIPNAPHNVAEVLIGKAGGVGERRYEPAVTWGSTLFSLNSTQADSAGCARRSPTSAAVLGLAASAICELRSATLLRRRSARRHLHVHLEQLFEPLGVVAEAAADVDAL